MFKFKRDLSNRPFHSGARNLRSRIFVRPLLQHRGQRFGNRNERTRARARGLHTRSCRRCDASPPKPLRTSCRIHFRKLRMLAYINLSHTVSFAAVANSLFKKGNLMWHCSAALSSTLNSGLGEADRSLQRSQSGSIETARESDMFCENQSPRSCRSE